MNNYQFWDELGNIFNAVLAYQQKTIEFNKRFVTPWIQMGGVFDPQEDNAKAVSARKQAVEIDPDNAENFVALGDAYFKIGQLDEAGGAYAQAVQLNPRAGWAYANLALVHATRDNFEEAVGLYKQSLELITDSKDSAMIWNRLGNAYRKLNDYENACVAFQMADEWDAGNTGFDDRLDADPVSVQVTESGEIAILPSEMPAESNVIAPEDIVALAVEAIAEEPAVIEAITESVVVAESSTDVVGVEDPTEEEVVSVIDESSPVAEVAAEIQPVSEEAQAVESVVVDVVLEMVEPEPAMLETFSTEGVTAPQKTVVAEEVVVAESVLEMVELEPAMLETFSTEGVTAPQKTVVAEEVVVAESVLETVEPEAAMLETVEIEAVTESQELVVQAEVSLDESLTESTITPVPMHETESISVSMALDEVEVVVVNEASSAPDDATEEEVVAEAASEPSVENPVDETQAQPDVQVEAVEVAEPVADGEAQPAIESETVHATEPVAEVEVQQSEVVVVEEASNESIIQEIISLVDNNVSEADDMPEFLKQEALEQESNQPLPTEAKFEIEPDTKNAHVWNELGNVYFDTGAYEEAIAAYSKSIELDVRFAWPYSNLALAYVQKEKYDEAVLLYQRSIELFATDKDKAVTFNRLGNVYRRMNNYDNAISSYQRADELDPHNATRSLRSRFSLLGSMNMELSHNLAM